MISKDFIANLKEQWLDYCEANPSTIAAFKETKFGTKSADSGFRPYGLFILGVICGLSPELSELISVFIKISSDSDHLIRSLGLDFDPEKELEKRAEERSQQAVNQLESQFSDPELEKIRQELQTN